MKKIVSLIIILTMLSMLLIGCSNSTVDPTDENSIKIGLILSTGGLGDLSFNDLTYSGVQRAEEDFGITYDYVEPKSAADCEVLQREMASSGEYDLVIAVGFVQADGLKKVAPEFPDQKFAIIDSRIELPNVASYLSKEHEGSFLIGIMAGMMKKNNVPEDITDRNLVGVIGGVNNAIINKFIAGYMAGVKVIMPDAQILVDYVGGFADPTTAKEIANTMYSRGVDIIYHAAGGSGLGLFESAKENGFYTFGVNSNQNNLAPDYIVASMMKNVDNATYSVIESIVNDNFEPEIYNLGIAENGVGYATEGSNVELTSDIIATVDEYKEKILDGTLTIPEEIDSVDQWVSENKDN